MLRIPNYKTRSPQTAFRLLQTLAVVFLFTGAPLRAQFAYVANLGDNTVSAYSVGSNGALTPVPGSPFATGRQPSSVTVDPTGTYAYIVNYTDDTVSAYSIDSDGSLTPVPGSPFTTLSGAAPSWVTVDPTARFVYVACENGAVSAYSIVSGESLTPVPGSPFGVAAGASPTSVAVDPTAKFVYVEDYSNSAVSAFSIGSDGSLTQVPGSPFAAGSGYSLTVDPKAKFVYEEDGAGHQIFAFSIGSGGILTPVPGSPFPVGVFSWAVVVDPTAKFFYVTEFDPSGLPGSVSAYSIGPDGALTPVSGSPFAAGIMPISVAVDPAAQFIYAGNYTDGTVSAYSIGSDGALTPVPGSPFAAGTEPISVVVTPVPFAAATAALHVKPSRFLPSFTLDESITLGANSNYGINPFVQDVTMQIGSFSQAVPVGSFIKKRDGAFHFAGIFNEVLLKLTISPVSGNNFTFTAHGEGLSLSPVNPVTVGLTIGGNTGTTTVTPTTPTPKN